MKHGGGIYSPTSPWLRRPPAPVLLTGAGIAARPQAEAALAVCKLKSDVRGALKKWLRTLGQSTVRRYFREVRAFRRHIRRSRGRFPRGLLAASPADCAAFVNQTKEYSRSTRSVRAAVVRNIYRVLVDEGLIGHDPAATVRPQGGRQCQHHRAIPEELLHVVLDQLRDSDAVVDVRDRALLLTMLDLGTRRSEAANLTVGDLERDGASYLVNVLGKGEKPVRMSLRPAAAAAIDRWLKVAGHGDDPGVMLFWNLSVVEDLRLRRSLTPGGVYAIVKKRFPKYSPHGLRARAITDTWRRSDGNLGRAQAFARHSSPTVTDQVYIQAQKLEEAMAFGPDYE